MHRDWKKDIIDVKRVCESIALIFIVEQDTFNVISAYTPYVGLT